MHSDTIPNPTPSKDQKKGRVVKRAYSFFRRKSVRNGRGAKNEHGTKDAKTMPDDLSETQQLVFWPYDLLPAVCKEARILTWGYDTQITKYYREPTSKTNVFVLGKSLLWELARNRARDRPIVFVAHSLGGIVIKQVSIDEKRYADVCFFFNLLLENLKESDDSLLHPILTLKFG